MAGGRRRVPPRGRRRRPRPASLRGAKVDRVETDVGVYRLRIAAGERGVVLAWDYPGSTLLRVRIVRAALGVSDAAAPPPLAAGDADAAGGDFPEAVPEPPGDSAWRVVYEGGSGSFCDRDIVAGGRYRYAVFARDANGPWVLWREIGCIV